MTQFRKPEVRIVGFGDTSLDFELLVWIDISKTSEKDIKSRLYFSVAEELSKAGIESPTPMRDIHIKGTLPSVDACAENQREAV